MAKDSGVSAVFDGAGSGSRGEHAVLFVQDDGYGNPGGGAWCRFPVRSKE